MNSGETGASRYPTQAARKAKRAEEKRRRLETPEIRAAREAREELEKCSAERDEECIYADLARRLDLRERYWTAFETWVRCQRIVEQMKCDKKLRLAVGPDVQIKVDEDIVTAEGYNDLKREVLVLYTMEHSDYLYQRDWCGDAWFASLMIRPPVDEFDDAYEPTWVAKQSIKFAKPWTKRRLEKKARELEEKASRWRELGIEFVCPDETQAGRQHRQRGLGRACSEEELRQDVLLPSNQAMTSDYALGSRELRPVDTCPQVPHAGPASHVSRAFSPG